MRRDFSLACFSFIFLPHLVFRRFSVVSLAAALDYGCLISNESVTSLAWKVSIFTLWNVKYMHWYTRAGICSVSTYFCSFFRFSSVSMSCHISFYLMKPEVKSQ